MFMRCRESVKLSQNDRISRRSHGEEAFAAQSETAGLRISTFKSVGRDGVAVALLTNTEMSR